MVKIDKTKVGVVGYGTIGKRVADAVLLQEDMELIGVTGRSYNFRMEVAHRKKIPIYITEGGEEYHLLRNNIRPVGTIHDLLSKVDLIVDCTPGGTGRENKIKYYLPNKVKAIFQGGEKADVAEGSFNAQCNYPDALNKNYVRVVSCNTTGIGRTIKAIDSRWPIKKVRATLIRRAADPVDIKKGPINAIIPSLELPSHHGPDVNTILPHVDIMTTAVVVSTTLMHVHCLSIELKNNQQPTYAEVLNQLKNTSRIFLIRGDTKVTSTAEIMELVRDLYHLRGDVVDTCIWEKGIGVVGNEIFIIQAIHQESDVIPENIDCIRAMMGFTNAEESIKKTNQTLGIK